MGRGAEDAGGLEEALGIGLSAGDIAAIDDGVEGVSKAEEIELFFAELKAIRG